MQADTKGCKGSGAFLPEMTTISRDLQLVATTRRELKNLYAVVDANPREPTARVCCATNPPGASANVGLVVSNGAVKGGRRRSGAVRW